MQHGQQMPGSRHDLDITIRRFESIKGRALDELQGGICVYTDSVAASSASVPSTADILTLIESPLRFILTALPRKEVSTKSRRRLAKGSLRGLPKVALLTCPCPHFCPKSYLPKLKKKEEATHHSFARPSLLSKPPILETIIPLKGLASSFSSTILLPMSLK